MAVDEQYAQVLRENEKMRAALRDLPTVRDQFAMAAMTGCLPGSQVDPDERAQWAYRMADAMMRARGVMEDPVCPHGIHMDNACGACVPPRGSTIRPSGVAVGAPALPLPPLDARVSALRWLLNLTTEHDRNDVRTRQAARLLDDYSVDGKTNRELLEELWRLVSGTSGVAVVDKENDRG